MGQQFRVEWQLYTPMVVGNMPLHLDALLAWARVQEALEQGSVDPLAVQHDLPIERFESGSNWCFKASALGFEYAGDLQMLHYSKRSDIYEYADAYMAGLFRRLPGFNSANGQTKGASIQLMQRMATKAVAFGVGDIERVRALLIRVSSLGKLKRRAKGAIRSFEVLPDDRASQGWMYRNLPHDAKPPEGAQYALAQQRLHPPYWGKQMQAVLAPIDGGGFLA